MKHKIINALIACYLLTACQRADVENLKVNETISLEAQIGIPLVKSRYVTSNEIESSFTEDDKIGLFRDDDTVIGWELKSNNWRSEKTMYWTGIDIAHNFYAYYPFSSSERNIRTAIVMPALKNQTGNLADISKYDFLVSKLIDRKYSAGSTISFLNENSFKHVSSLVKLTLKGGGDFGGATLTSLEISGDMLSSVTKFSFDEPEGSQVMFEGDKVYTTITASGLSVNMNSDKVFYFVVNEYKAATNAINLILGYTINGSDKTVTVDFDETKFISGKLHPYAISIINGTVNIIGSAIEDWKNDVEIIDIIIDGSE